MRRIHPGDNVCECNETAYSCAPDCGLFCTSVCGDNICECGEDDRSCPADCGWDWDWPWPEDWAQ